MVQTDVSGAKPATPNTPWLVDPVYTPIRTMPYVETMNLVNNVKDAAGSTVVVKLPGGKIFDLNGTKIGSYWGKNDPVYSTPLPSPNGSFENVISGVVTTDGSAACAIYDATYDLEKLFESNTLARYVLKLTDRAGKAIYGYVGGVAASSNVYTFSIYSEVGLSNQNWQKDWGTGIAEPYAKIEIFENSSSIVMADSDTFDTELPYSEYATDHDQLKNLANGEYRIDYRRGRLLGRKKDADDTEVISYTALANEEETRLGVGNKDVTAAGTAEALSATSRPFKRLVIQGKAANTNAIYVGDANVASTDGVFIFATYTLELFNGDLADVYIDADTSGEGVQYTYWY